MNIARPTAISLVLALGASPALGQQERLPENQPTIVDGIETVCTGVATDVREDPRWHDYSLRLEFVGRAGQYLGDEAVTVSGNGHSISVRCAGPWVLMKLPAGSYRVSADVAQAGQRELTVRVPGRVIVRFPEAGGGVRPPEERIATR